MNIGKLAGTILAAAALATTGALAQTGGGTGSGSVGGTGGTGSGTATGTAGSVDRTRYRSHRHPLRQRSAHPLNA